MKKARVKATLVLARALEPGDLFSTYGMEYWKDALTELGIGERVYVRTNQWADIAADADTTVFKIEIEKYDDEAEGPTEATRDPDGVGE